LQDRRMFDALCRAPSLVRRGPDDVAMGIRQLPWCTQMVGMVVQNAGALRFGFGARCCVLQSHLLAQLFVQRQDVGMPDKGVVSGLLQHLVQRRVGVGAVQQVCGRVSLVFRLLPKCSRPAPAAQSCRVRTGRVYGGFGSAFAASKELSETKT